MKPIFRTIVFSAAFYCIINVCCAQTSAVKAPRVRAIYTGSTPCSEGTRPLTQIAVTDTVEFITWKLTLNEDSTYALHCTYGLSKPGITGFMNGGKNIDATGVWAIGKGTKADPKAVVYQLDPGKPAVSIAFIQLDDNLLHLLDRERRLMVGSASWSYTLNRVNQ